MRLLFLLLAFAMVCPLLSQVDFYTDVDDYSFIPGLVDHQNLMEADAFYQTDFSRFDGAAQNMAGQVNYWVADRHNVGVNYVYREIGQVLAYEVKGNYAYLFSLNKVLLKPYVQFGFQRFSVKPRFAAGNPNLIGNLSHLSGGLALNSGKFNGGLALESIVQITGQDFYELSSLLKVHLDYLMELGSRLKVTPFLRPDFGVNSEFFIATGGLSASYAEFAEIWAAMNFPQRADNKLSSQLRFGGGISILPGLWLRYQYVVFMADYANVSIPSNQMGISFDLPKSQN